MADLYYEILPEFRDPSTWPFLQTLGTRKYVDDVGFDLPAACNLMILPSRFIDVPVGVRIALPRGYWGRITGRSSTLRKRGLLIVEGVLDGGYRGPLFLGCYNLTSLPVKIEMGERLGQLIIGRNYASGIRWLMVENLPGSDRGSEGFGSTGR